MAYEYTDLVAYLKARILHFSLIPNSRPIFSSEQVEI